MDWRGLLLQNDRPRPNLMGVSRLGWLFGRPNSPEPYTFDHRVTVDSDTPKILAIFLFSD